MIEISFFAALFCARALVRLTVVVTDLDVGSFNVAERDGAASLHVYLKDLSSSYRGREVHDGRYLRLVGVDHLHFYIVQMVFIDDRAHFAGGGIGSVHLNVGDELKGRTSECDPAVEIDAGDALQCRVWS